MTDDEIRALLDAATLPDVDYSTMRAEVDKQTYPRAARLFMRHHIARKKEKLVSVLAMHTADMSLRECEGLPHLFAAAPALANAALEARAELATVKAERDAAVTAARLAHDALWELNPSNYDHDEVCKANDGAIEAILTLAPIIGETHGKVPEWWATRAALLAAKSEPALELAWRVK